MRTTLTLDDDVAARLKAIQHQRKLSFRDAVNFVLRLGIEQSSAVAQPRKKFVLKTRDLQVRPGIDLSNIEQLLDDVEGPART